MAIGTQCANCGKLKPQFARGDSVDEHGTPFTYTPSPLCMPCRHGVNTYRPRSYATRQWVEALGGYMTVLSQQAREDLARENARRPS